MVSRLRLALKWLLIACLAGIVWVGWPIYGFLSNQFETARIPFGWIETPEVAPTSQRLEDPRYKSAGDRVLQVLAERQAKLNAPSLSAAVAIDGQLVWSGAVGWSDISGEMPATPDTIYRIGSTSKAITATVLARLVSKGSIDLDAPISDYLSAMPNEDWQNMTARQLASHTACLPDYENNTDRIGFYQSLALTKHYQTVHDSLSVFDGSDLQCRLGTDFGYSGYGTILLSAVIAEVSGTSFEAALFDLVFKPSQARSTGADHSLEFLGPRAVSYQKKQGRHKAWRTVNLSHKVAAGGLVSTPTDLVLIGSAWLDEDFIPANIQTEFWTPNTLSSDPPHNQDYALGWRKKSWNIEGFGDFTHYNHGGISKGSQAWLMVIPEHNMSVAITTNTRTNQFFDFADVYVDILEAFIPAYQTVP